MDDYNFKNLKPRGYYNHHSRKSTDSVYDLDPYIMNGEFINIDERDDICTVCCGVFRHKTFYRKRGDYTEVDICTSHTYCRNVMKKIHKKRKAIDALKLDLEYKTFLSNDTV
tara:strand:+ start:618 stop:953 length:336 start_codon:yes stop_codon:yes gene_type:complete